MAQPGQPGQPSRRQQDAKGGKKGGKAAKTTKVHLTLIAAPGGTGKMLGTLMRGYSAGMQWNEDGTEASAMIERRKARDVQFKIRKLWGPKQIAIRFAAEGRDITDEVSGEPAPEVIVDAVAPKNPKLARLQAEAKAKAAARAAGLDESEIELDEGDEGAEEPEGPPIHRRPAPQPPVGQGVPTPAEQPDQAWGWKRGARDPLPEVDADEDGGSVGPVGPVGGFAGLNSTYTEGQRGTWPYGSMYRAIDEAKLEAFMRRPIRAGGKKLGKQKITLGAQSDRSYLVEPDRDRGGWVAWRLTADAGKRIGVGHGDTFAVAVQGIQAYEREQALAQLPKRPAPAPQAAPAARPQRPVAQAATPAPKPGPAARVAQAQAAQATPAPLAKLPVAPSGQFAMCMAVAGHHPRWTIQRGEDVLAAGDDLEEAVIAAFGVANVPLLVFGWNGALPRKTPKAPPPKMEPIELMSAPVPPSNLQARLAAALAAQTGGEVEGEELDEDEALDEDEELDEGEGEGEELDEDEPAEGEAGA